METEEHPGSLRRERVKDFLVGFVAGLLGATVAVVIRGGPAPSWPQLPLIAVGTGTVIGLSSMVRRGAMRTARRRAAERRRESGLPPAEEKSFRQEWQEDPVRTSALLVAVFVFVVLLGWLRTR